MDASQINKEIDKIVKNIGNKVVGMASKEIKEKVSNIIVFGKREIKKYIDDSMQNEFKNLYGNNFSTEALKQLYSTSIVNFRPEILYTEKDINIFKSNLDTESLLDDMDDFILDAEENEDYYDEELYNEYYGDEGNIEDEIDYQSKQKINWKSSYYNKTFREGEVPNVQDAFKLAKEKTMQKFNSEELPKLKAYSKKIIGMNIF